MPGNDGGGRREGLRSSSCAKVWQAVENRLDVSDPLKRQKGTRDHPASWVAQTTIAGLLSRLGSDAALGPARPIHVGRGHKSRDMGCRYQPWWLSHEFGLLHVAPSRHPPVTRSPR